MEQVDFLPPADLVQVLPQIASQACLAVSGPKIKKYGRMQQFQRVRS